MEKTATKHNSSLDRYNITEELNGIVTIKKTKEFKHVKIPLILTIDFAIAYSRIVNKDVRIEHEANKPYLIITPKTDYKELIEQYYKNKPDEERRISMAKGQYKAYICSPDDRLKG